VASAALSRLWQEKRFPEGAELARRAMVRFPEEPRFGVGLTNFLLAAGELAKAEEEGRRHADPGHTHTKHKPS
jgi:hypothetical protein